MGFMAIQTPRPRESVACVAAGGFAVGFLGRVLVGEDGIARAYLFNNARAGMRYGRASHISGVALGAQLSDPVVRLVSRNRSVGCTIVGLHIVMRCVAGHCQSGNAGVSGRVGRRRAGQF